jgi:hypothetical protein
VNETYGRFLINAAIEVCLFLWIQVVYHFDSKLKMDTARMSPFGLACSASFPSAQILNKVLYVPQRCE